MTLVRGRRLFVVALVVLATALVDASYLISSATRPPRLKHHQREPAATAGETGSPSSSADVDRSVYRQSAPSAKAATAARNLANSGQTYPSLDSHRGWSPASRSNFLNGLQPAARAFLLHGGHRANGEGLRSGGGGGASRNKRDRNQFERGYPDVVEYPHGLPDVEDNIIDESPKSSKNLNYYPYRGKRPFEVPQIGECRTANVRGGGVSMNEGGCRRRASTALYEKFVSFVIWPKW